MQVLAAPRHEGWQPSHWPSRSEHHCMRTNQLPTCTRSCLWVDNQIRYDVDSVLSYEGSEKFWKKKKNFFSSESTFVAGQFVSVVKPPLTHWNFFFHQFFSIETIFDIYWSSLLYCYLYSHNIQPRNNINKKCTLNYTLWAMGGL